MSHIYLNINLLKKENIENYSVLKFTDETIFRKQP